MCITAIEYAQLWYDEVSALRDHDLKQMQLLENQTFFEKTYLAAGSEECIPSPTPHFPKHTPSLAVRMF
jgi:hypothetical protein